MKHVMSQYQCAQQDEAQPSEAAPPEADGTEANQPVAIALSTSLLRWASKTLLADQREAVIEHHGMEYRLRLTGQGKLILTK